MGWLRLGSEVRDAMAKVRRLVVYGGRVQGVGFRATARRLASGIVVEGFVRNLDDGRVELLAEGEPEQVGAFLDAVDQAFGPKIQSKAQEDRDPGESPVSGFLIAD